MNSSSGIISLPLLVAALMAIVIVGAGGVFIYTNQQEQSEPIDSTPVAVVETEPAATAEPTPLATTAPPKTPAAQQQAGWKSFMSESYRVRFQYPSEWEFAVMNGADLNDKHILKSFEVTPPGWLGGPEYFVMVTDRSLQTEIERQSSNITRGGATEIVSITNVARYGQQGKQMTYRNKTSDSVNSTYFFAYEGRTYQLAGETSSPHMSTVARIAETFHFLP